MFEVSPEFVKTLRKAKSVLMNSRDGKAATIRIVVEHRIGSSTRTFEEDVKFEFEFDYTALPFMFNTMFTDISGWSALSKLIKKGDKLNFSMMDNSNCYLKNATTCVENGREEYKGIHKDELNVSIHRNGKLWLQKLMLESVCAPDNSARAINPDSMFMRD